MLLYSTLRVGIFVVVGFILYLFGLRSWPLLLLAAVISAVISLLVLNRPREKFASQIETKVERRRVKHREAEARHPHRTAEQDEDDELDA